MDKITKERLTYNKALIANGYISMGKRVKAYDLVCKIEKEVEGESLENRKTIIEIAKIYEKLGYSGKSNAIYNERIMGSRKENIFRKYK